MIGNPWKISGVLSRRYQSNLGFRNTSAVVFDHIIIGSVLLHSSVCSVNRIGKLTRHWCTPVCNVWPLPVGCLLEKNKTINSTRAYMHSIKFLNKPVMLKSFKGQATIYTPAGSCLWLELVYNFISTDVSGLESLLADGHDTFGTALIMDLFQRAGTLTLIYQTSIDSGVKIISHQSPCVSHEIWPVPAYQSAGVKKCGASK